MRSNLQHELWMQENFKQTPALNFPVEWAIRILPGTGGALTRFMVDDRVSVYFDIDDSLGSVGRPYWEIYPNAEGDTSRFLAGEEAQLFIEIQSALDSRDM